LFFHGGEPGFAEEGDEDFLVFAWNVRILERAKKEAVDFGVVEATIQLLMSKHG
jgi:hypothetical protein